MKNSNKKLYIINKNDTRWDNFYNELKKEKNIFIVHSLNPLEFNLYLQRSCIILTDSAGVQQEATFFKKKIIVFRKQVELNRNYYDLSFCPPPYLSLAFLLKKNIKCNKYSNKSYLIKKSKKDILRVCKKIISIEMDTL